MRNRSTLLPKFARAGCFDPANCSDPACQGFLASYHQITEQDYNDMVEAFFGTTVLPTFNLQVSNINLNVSCDGHRVEFNMNENNTNDNNEVVVEIKPGYEIVGKYSIALFKGIINLFEPDTFHFSKAKEDSGNKTLAFYATKDDAPVYFGDLSSLYP